MVYAWATEHSPSIPLSRGWSIFAINATTGTEIWQTIGSMSPTIVSDGYLTAGNVYDGYVYCFGMGLSATTVSAPQTAITAGTNVTISGTVLDQSPAQPGTACVSDASMGDWMAYLHQQATCPANVTGVPVSINAIDPNGNPVHIATVTSDALGGFGCAWTPTTPGLYKITTTFAGTDSYSYSSADARATVNQAPTATSTTQPTQAATDYTMTIIGTGIAVILAVAIVGVLMLRKRP